MEVEEKQRGLARRIGEKREGMGVQRNVQYALYTSVKMSLHNTESCTRNTQWKLNTKIEMEFGRSWSRGWICSKYTEFMYEIPNNIQ